MRFVFELLTGFFSAPQLMIRDDTAEPTFVEFLVCADVTDGEWGDGSVQTG